MQAQGGGSIVNVGSMWAHQAIKATPLSLAREGNAFSQNRGAFWDSG